MAGWGLFTRSDTFAFFYPVFAALHQSLRQGTLPLWTPYIFGGFPLFAEGQTGALYPPNLAAATLAEPAAGFVALRVFHMGIALLGMYAFLRALRIAPFGATIGACAFGLGSFVVAQQHHGSLLAAAVWLPLLLALVELALRRADWSTDGLLALAGLTLGMQALASHIQPVLFSAALVSGFVTVRQAAVALAAVRTARSLRAGLAAPAGPALLGLWAIVVVAGVGGGVAAVQLLPLYELSRESWRAQAWSYQDAIQYSLPPVNLITLVFPYFFRAADGDHWSLWQYWEVVIHVGIVPLVLAAVGLSSRRRGLSACFALVGGLALVLSVGGYLPLGLYETIWTLPGVQLQRAPARLTYLATFALAVLAALGAERLAGRPPDAGLPANRVLPTVQVSALALIALIVGHLVIWRAWLHANPHWALDVLAEWYLALPRDFGHTLTPIGVFEALDGALNPGNPKTWFPLVILGAFAATLVGWRELPRWGAGWKAALATIAAVELVIFALDFHPVAPIAKLGELGPAGEVLAASAGDSRVWTDRAVESPRPNELLPARIAEAGGYSPLELDRHRWYGDAVATVPNSLLDLWGVRHLVVPRRVPDLPSYELVAFHPTRPLLIGGSRTENGRLGLRANGEPATEVRTVAALVDGDEITEGDVIGEWVLTDDRGARQLLELRAGHDVADWGHEEPGRRTAHGPAHWAARIPIRDGPSGATVGRTLSYAAQRLAGRARVAHAEYRHVHSRGKTILYGVALYDAQTERASQSFLPDKLTEVYRDADLLIYENANAFPLAWVVRESAVASSTEILTWLSEGEFDARRQVLLERPVNVESSPTTGASDGWARVQSNDGEEIVIFASAPSGGILVLSDAYYPGWHASVNGEDVEILRANYLFRAVPLPPGEHEVRFVFDPSTLRLGKLVSTATLAMAMGLCALSLWASRGQWGRWGAKGH